MNIYEKYLKDLDENKLLDAIDISIKLEKKYGKGYLGLVGKAIQQADEEIFDILNIFKALNLNISSLKNIKSLINSKQGQKFVVSSNINIAKDLETKLGNVSENITSKIGVKIQSQNLGFQRNLEDDLNKLLG